MQTEQISPRYVELDSWSAAEMIAAMYEGQLAAAAAVRGALGAIATAVEDAVPALQRGGRIVYAGAGTSGRIGVQDGSELPPTFDWPADRLVFAMAGGIDALARSVEQAEDNQDDHGQHDRELNEALTALATSTLELRMATPENHGPTCTVAPEQPPGGLTIPPASDWYPIL